MQNIGICPSRTQEKVDNDDGMMFKAVVYIWSQMLDQNLRLIRYL